MNHIQSVLVDATNFDHWAPIIISEIANCKFAGIDTETQDDARHDGLNQFCGYDPITRKKAANKKLVFDFWRTVMCGFSLYPENGERAYYVNLNHADVENRVPWARARTLIDALPQSSHWLAHNAQYELTVFKTCYDFELPRTICTLQMAVSAFGPDEYSIHDFIAAGQGGIKAVIPELLQNAAGFVDRNNISPKLQEAMTKVISKQSTAAHSYNGFVKDVSYGYGLKKLVQKFFKYDMTTFDQVLQGKAHMGQLTGAETVAYGCDDAYWVLPLFHRLLQYMSENCPTAIPTFFSQENPMVQVYSDLAVQGMQVNGPAIFERKAGERSNNAHLLRELKAVVRRMLPFEHEPHKGLFKRDSWYTKGYATYRKRIVDWANRPDTDDEFEQCHQTRGAVANAWALELKKPESTGPNLSHYMVQRTLLYDLTGADLLIEHGKTQSDGNARGKLKDKFQHKGLDDAVEMIDILNKLASVDQRIKLFITPYTQLMDPDTRKLHPVVTSMLATRRMAAQDPNPLQLAKRGESTYVRGFFEADYDDHVIISEDWSAVELVLVGEFSADPEFKKAFGQRPHEDLHGGAAASVLSIPCPGLDEQIFKTLKSDKSEEKFRDLYSKDVENIDRIFTDLKGQPLSGDKAFGFWRTELGKGSNFSYWYSGMLNTIGQKMGWDFDTMMTASKAYAERFSVAEAWRLNVIDTVRRKGVVQLFDGHTRTRFEATPQWMDIFLRKFQLENPDGDDLIQKYNEVWNYMANKIQRRSFNQAVNAMIQGSAATLAKRSILRLREIVKAKGWGPRECRFMLSIHDELLFSVHRDLVVEAVHMIREAMIDHPDMFQHCLLDASPAIGLTFEPFHPVKVPFGQIEVAEAPPMTWVSEENHYGWMSNDDIQSSVDYLFHSRMAAAA